MSATHIDLGPDLEALDALLLELDAPTRTLALPDGALHPLRAQPSVPSSLRSSSLPQPDAPSNHSATSLSLQPHTSNGPVTPPVRSSSRPPTLGSRSPSRGRLRLSDAGPSTPLDPSPAPTHYLTSTPPDDEPYLAYLRPPSAASFATTVSESSAHHSSRAAPPVQSEDMSEETAAMVNQLYARLEAQGVPGDGWEQGVERSRDGILSAQVVMGGATVGRRGKGNGLIARESEILPPGELMLLKKVDRYGFFSNSALTSEYHRIATLKRAPLSVIPGENKKSPRPPPTPPQSAATLAHRASTASFLPTLSAAESIRETSRIGKWADMLTVETRDEGGNAQLWTLLPIWWEGRLNGGGKYRGLQKRVMKGVPDRWRSAVWGCFAEKREASTIEPHRSLDDIQAEYRLFLTVPSDQDVQIDLDVPRTISGHVQFHTRYGKGQRALFHTLHAAAIFTKDIGGYCQGMGAIAATLLCYFEPERAYACLVRMLSSYGLLRIFEPGFPGLLESFYVQERLVELLMPEVHQAFATTNFVSTSSYATKWYITLFSQSVPFSTQLRLWDFLFLEGICLLELTAVAIIWSFRDTFTAPKADFETILSTLSSFFLVDDDDMLLRWIRKTLQTRDLRKKMDQWRLDWRGFVEDGSASRRGT